MKLYILSNDALDSLKGNVRYNKDNYKNDDNKWIEKQLAYDPFIEFKKSVDDFKLDPQAKEIENTKVLYTAMKNITDSEATEERLWSGMSHGVLWNFMKKKFEYDIDNNSRFTFDENTILNRYFLNRKVNGWKRAMQINILSRMWWMGRLCYDENNKKDPFHYLVLFETAFSHKTINTFSSNILGNKDIRFAYFDAGLYIKSLNIEIKGDTMVPMMVYLNGLGGSTLLDILSRNEIYDLLVHFINENIDVIKSR